MFFSHQTSSLQWMVPLKSVILVWSRQLRRIAVMAATAIHRRRYYTMVDIPIKLALNFTWVQSKWVLVHLFLSLLNRGCFCWISWNCYYSVATYWEACPSSVCLSASYILIREYLNIIPWTYTVKIPRLVQMVSLISH